LIAAVVGIFSYKKKRVCIISEPAGYLLYISFCGWTWSSPRVNLVKGCGFEEEQMNASYTDGQQSHDRTK
jgi:hypothetical protein